MTGQTAAGPQPGNELPRRSLRGFWCLFVTQFQNAFSDNVLKFLVTFLIVGMGLTNDQRNQLVPAVGILFSVPFILFSMAGGNFADRYSKRTVTITIKCMEVGIMSLATVGLWKANIPILLACIFLMGTHSAFFSPTKYGLLPELLPEKQLSWGNGIVGLGTFMAIIVGAIAAGMFSDKFGKNQVYSGFVLIALAVFGLVMSLQIDRVPPADTQRKFKVNFISDFFTELATAHKDRVLFLGVLGSTYVYFLGALLQPTIIFYGKDILHLKDTESGLLQGALAIGIALGSLAAGFLSGKKIEYGLVPLGMIGLAASGAMLARSGLTFSGVAWNLGVVGFFGGFYNVPVSAIVQHRPEPAKKGRVIAMAGLLSFVGISIAGGIYYMLAVWFKLQPHHIFLVGAGFSVAGAIYGVWLLPDSLIRLVLWMLTRTIYRVRVEGRDNIPERGGALFVCNHVSFVDALLLMASTDRHVRFMMYKEGYELPWLKPFARIMGIIPISSEQRPRDLLKSLQAASDAIKAGEVVCIFAEGQITRIGQMLPFRRGMERIMKDVDAPIVPVALDGVWGSMFSFQGGKFIWKWPKQIPYPVTVSFGKPMLGQSSAFEIRQAVQELMAAAWHRRRERMKPLQRQFVRMARRHPRRLAMADAQTKKVSFSSALTRSVFLGRRLKRVWSGQRMVGLLLPPSVPGALVNHAVLLAGKVPVNLNYTVSAEALASCIKQCDIKTVVASRVFMEKLKLKVPGEVVYLEDIAAKPGVVEMVAAFLMTWLFPAGLLERALGREKKVELDDLATVIFSSGSTGEPKGVMLSHYNVGSNIGQMEQVFGLDGHDRMLGILPFFHSFGFTGTLCLPASLGIGAIYHANPLDAKTIGPLVRDYSITFLLATPTFLQLYMRGCDPGDFGSLRVVMTGAEKLSERLATAFEEHFSIRPLEGYGCTECSPAVALNIIDFRSAGFRQVGGKRGKIGHPLPGISVRIVDAETMSPVPMGQPGMLLVRGPNVMQGYLGKPEKTADVLRDGWYTTGDVATLDEDGFLQITDRLSRFSKIGGEMVPHIKIEERLHEMAETAEQLFVVTGVPDEKKGERLVVLHKLPDDKLKSCLEKFAQTELPNLWKPKADAFFHIQALPYLGTGKLDLRKVKELALQFSNGQATPPA